jgi:transposase
MARHKSRLDALPVLDPHTAGIDVHAAVHWVAVPPDSAPPDPLHSPELPPEVRSFGACTADLHQLADWLARCGVTSVAMESTGAYWIPLFELLERRGFTTFVAQSSEPARACTRRRIGSC